jgi:hypothetical protein
MPVYIDDARPVGAAIDDMIVPDFFVKCAGSAGHAPALGPEARGNQPVR